MPPKVLIGIVTKEEKLSVCCPERSQPRPCESPTCRTLGLLLQKPEKRERMEGHEEQVTEGNHQFLRPGSGDLIWPERKKISPCGNGVGKRRPNASRGMCRVCISEEKIPAL